MSSIWAKEGMFVDCMCVILLYYPSLVEGESHGLLLPTVQKNHVSTIKIVRLARILISAYSISQQK